MHNDLEAQIESALAFLSMASPRPAVGQRWKKALPLSHFDGAEPMTVGYMEAFEAETAREWQLPVFWDIAPRDLGRDVDACWLGDMRDDPNDLAGPLRAEEDEGLFLCAVRVRRVGANASKRIVVRAHTVCEIAVAGFRHDGSYASMHLYAAWIAGEWVPASSIGSATARHWIPFRRFVRFAHSLQFVRRYDWRVNIAIDSGPSVAFVTDPIGAREVFRLRDIPNGGERRAALLHWVSEHWRKRRKDPDEERKVRAHLRGATEFQWNGLRCCIRPSEFDAEQAQWRPAVAGATQ